jgi:hypothetical protein
MKHRVMRAVEQYEPEAVMKRDWQELQWLSL